MTITSAKKKFVPLRNFQLHQETSFVIFFWFSDIGKKIWNFIEPNFFVLTDFTKKETFSYNYAKNFCRISPILNILWSKLPPISVLSTLQKFDPSLEYNYTQNCYWISWMSYWKFFRDVIRYGKLCTKKSLNFKNRWLPRCFVWDGYQLF